MLASNPAGILNQKPPDLGIPIRFRREQSRSSEKFDEIRELGGEGLIVVAGVLTYARRQQIGDLGLSFRLPSCSGFYEIVALGRLASLVPDMLAMASQAAAYIDKVMHGSDPADLPAICSISTGGLLKHSA
jgi:hypothetical protein